MRIKVSKFSRTIFLLIIMKLIASCAPESCLENTTSFVNVSFYKSGTNMPLAPDSITVFGIGNETNILYRKSLKLSTIRLPLDASKDACRFAIKINTLTDTLRFIYSSYPHLISKECGVTFFFNLDSTFVSGTVVDTFYVQNKNITNLNAENIRLFY